MQVSFRPAIAVYSSSALPAKSNLNDVTINYHRSVLFWSSRLRKQKAVGIVIADRPGGGQKEDTTLLSEFLDLTEKGTQFVRGDRIPINILTTPSHMLWHLQLADLIVGIVVAMVAGDTRYAAPLFPLVRSILIRGSSDNIGGTGLKLYPDELMNLYHWVLGEEEYTNARRGCISLPCDDASYVEQE